MQVNDNKTHACTLGVGLCLVLSLAGCKASPCDGEPTFPGCTKLQIQAIDDIARVAGAPVELSVPDLADSALPTLTVQSMAGGDPVMLTIVAINGGKVSAKLDTPGNLGVGPAVVRLQVGGRSAAEKNTWVYTPPALGTGLRQPYLTNQSAVSIAIQPRPGASTGSIFVTEDLSVTKERVLARYDWQPDRLLRDDTFATNTSVSGSLALFSITTEAVITYFRRFNPLPNHWVLRASGLSVVKQVDDELVNLQQATLLGSDFDRRFHVLYGLSTGMQPTLEVFMFDLAGTHSSLIPPTPVTSIRALATRHYELDALHQIDFATLNQVTVDPPAQLTFYSVRGLSNVPAELELSRSASMRVGNMNITAMTLGDLDQDGRPDLIVVDEGGQGVTEVSWFPYRGNGTFGSRLTVPLPLQSPAQLPEPPKQVVGIAVGDVNSDGKPDLAIASAAGIYVYPNMN